MSGTLTAFDTISLGGLIDALRQRPLDQSAYFNFWRFAPTGVDSYRGYYDHLAIGFREESGEPTTVAALLRELEQSVGATFQGYKGGDYRMDRGTPVWVGKWGDCRSTTITGVTGNDYETILQTGYGG